MNDFHRRSIEIQQVNYYKMSRPKRGMAIIFNHVHYHKNLGEGVRPRPGTNVDCHNLEDILRNLKFEVTICTNYTLEKIKNELQKAALRDHSESDCIMVIVLSHGNFGNVLAFDTTYDVNTLPKFFTADNCPTLAGKPKMFWISACGGNGIDPGVDVEVEIDTEIEMDTTSRRKFRIPIYADILVTFSSHPGYFAQK
ncbi:caspase-1-like [Temnothorax longispinosus]|uniref:caspase-1-like n=1 Tax=Temnothorax longispinosus TaxID=300112 RepID=UPI003A9A3A2A